MTASPISAQFPPPHWIDDEVFDDVDDFPSQAVFFRPRYYDPTVGRFTRLDPAAGSLASPLTLHKYGYAEGNPISGIDPSGLFTLRQLGVSVGILVSIGALINFSTPVSRNTSAVSTPRNQFIPVVTSQLGGVYHAVTIRGSILSADQLFSQMTRMSQLNMFPVKASGNITGVGGEVTFDMQNWGQGVGFFDNIGLLRDTFQGDFSVRVTKYDPAARFFVVRTLGGHPLAGWRAWGVRTQPNGDILIETFSVEHPATEADEWKMLAGGMSSMKMTWTSMLNDLAHISNGQIIYGPNTDLDGREFTSEEAQQYLKRVE